MTAKKKSQPGRITNRRARYDYELGDQFVKEGVQLGDLAMAEWVDNKGVVHQSIGIITDYGPPNMTGEANGNTNKNIGFDPDGDTGGQDDNVVHYHYFANSAQYWRKHVIDKKMTHQQMYEQGFKDMMTAQGEGDLQDPQKNSLLDGVRKKLNEESTYKGFDEKKEEKKKKN